MKIVVLDGQTINPGDLSWDGLKDYGDVTVYPHTDADRVEEHIGDAEIVIINKTCLSKEIFDRTPGIQYVGVVATGYDSVDVSAARQHGVTVCNVPDYGADTVAEMVFALLLELCRHTSAYDAEVKTGHWPKGKNTCMFGEPVTLFDKTMGIIGYGKIGQKAAAIARGFGMDVLVYSRRKERVAETPKLKYADIDTLLAQADVVSLHCPLTQSTKEMINSGTIAKMKNGAILINTSRGGLIDETALRDALCSGKLAGAGCDVVSVEPIQPDNPLLGAKNIVITPHVAWASRQSRQRLIRTTVDNVASFSAGKPIHVVN
jgi:glycerate dehydrogenase